MSRFRAVGRIAFARGNSSWARSFNQNLNMARGQFVSPLSQTRLLSSLAMSRMSTLGLAAEVPVGSGFAEQYGDMSPFNLSGVLDAAESELETDTEVEVSTEPAVDRRINKMSNLTQSCAYNFSQKTWSLRV